MGNRLDQLFKNKLGDHALAPSVNAWDRVKDGLAKKNNRPLMLRIAAAVMLVGALTTTLLWLSSKDSASNSSSSSAISKNAESKTKSIKPADSPRSIGEEKFNRLQQPVSKLKRQPDNQKVQSIIEDQNNVAHSVIRTEEPQESIGSSTTAGVGVTTVDSEQMEEKPIILVYRLESIEPHRAAESAVASEPKEKSGLLRVIIFARDAKNGDAGLGDLRQAKDELFAFNFRKDKQNNHK